MLSSKESPGLGKKARVSAHSHPSYLQDIISVEGAPGSRLHTRQLPCLCLSFQHTLETTPRLVFLRTQPSSCQSSSQNLKAAPWYERRPKTSLHPISWHSLHPVHSRGCRNICSVNTPLCHQVQILSYAIKAAQWN